MTVKFRDLHKRKLIFTWVRNQKADIIFLQETFSTPDVFHSWKFQWPGDMYFSHGSNHSKGGSKSEKRDVVTKIRELMLDLNLVDIWRLRNPDKKRYMWKQNKPLIHRRLDYWLISDDFQDDVDNTGIISAIKTDHAAIVLQISSVEKQPTGPSYWKFNSSLLEDPEYINLIKDNVPSWLVEFSDVSDKGLLWDLIKFKIRQVTMKFSKIKARERRSRLWEIKNKLKECQEIFDTFPTENNAIQLETIKSEYNSLYDYIIQGNVIRSRANWYEHGEKNNKYFLNLESRRMSNSCVRKLFDKGGKLISSPKLILLELHDFYTELYSNRDPSNHDNASDTFLDHCHLPTLNEDAQQICEGVLTKAECLKALQTFKNGKSPVMMA